MGRYPKPVRAATLKCIACNAPIVETVDDGYVCVECGESPIEPRSGDGSISLAVNPNEDVERPVAMDD